MVGGASSVLQGGKFGHGFAAAGATQAFAPGIDNIETGGAPMRIAVAAIVGGTISEATGGKFVNGAVTGAFSRAFNDEVGTREKVKTLKSSHGESKVDYIDRLGDEIFNLSQSESAEHCGNICSALDANGDAIYATHIMTDNDPVSCGISSTYCPSGYSPIGDGIHAHVRRFKVTEKLRKLHPEMRFTSKRSHGNINEFSENDLNFTSGKYPMGLYFARGRGLGNAYLPVNSKDLSSAQY